MTDERAKQFETVRNLAHPVLLTILGETAHTLPILEDVDLLPFVRSQLIKHRQKYLELKGVNEDLSQGHLNIVVSIETYLIECFKMDPQMVMGVSCPAEHETNKLNLRK